MNGQSHIDPELRQRMEEQTQAVGKWEETRRIPDSKRLTWYYPDFGCYVLKEYVTADRLAATIKEIEAQKRIVAEQRQSRKKHVGHER